MAHKALVIKDFQQGIGPSPHLGYADMRNLDIWTRPGVARLNNKTTKQSSTTVTDLPLWLMRNPRSTSDFWAVADTGKVYKGTSNGTSWSHVSGNTSGGAGQGGLIWKDYLFVPRSAAIDVYGPLSSSPAWTNSWQSIDSDSAWHPMIVGQDDKVYGGAGRYVFSISETAGDTFDPSDSASYTFNSQALDLPAEYRIKCLAEQGKELAIGTWMGSNIYEFKVADIFYWDRASDTFRLPVRIAEHGINAMLTKNNLLYVLAGIEGKVYVCNSIQASQIAQIPQSITGLGDGSYVVPYPGAITDYKGRVTFGMSTSPGGTAPGMGVWSLVQTSKGNVLTHEHTISTGSDGTSNQLLVGAVLSASQNSLMIGWLDNTTYGIDMVDTVKYQSYAGYLVSPLYQIGTHNAKETFSQIEVQLARPLTTSQGVRVSYRTNLTDSFTTVFTFDNTTYSAAQSMRANASISNIEELQLKVELTTGNLNTTPEVRAVILT